MSEASIAALAAGHSALPADRGRRRLAGHHPEGDDTAGRHQRRDRRHQAASHHRRRSCRPARAASPPSIKSFSTGCPASRSGTVSASAASSISGRLAALNVTAQERLAQLETNLKRVQGLMSINKAPRYVLVNVPSFVAQAVEHGTLALRQQRRRRQAGAGDAAGVGQDRRGQFLSRPGACPTSSRSRISSPRSARIRAISASEHFIVMRDWKAPPLDPAIGRLELAAGGELQVPPGARDRSTRSASCASTCPTSTASICTTRR